MNALHIIIVLCGKNSGFWNKLERDDERDERDHCLWHQRLDLFHVKMNASLSLSSTQYDEECILSF